MIHVSKIKIRMKQWDGLNNLSNVITKSKELSALGMVRILLI